MDDVNSWK